MKRVGTVVVTGLLLSSCSLLASRDEYALYRAFRYETNREQRTVRGSAYIARYPQGQFRSDIQGEVSGHEDDFWEERRSTLEGLQAYLEAFPSGPHAAEARTRIGVYEAERRRTAEQQAAADQA